MWVWGSLHGTGQGCAGAGMSLLGHMALLKLSPQPHFPLMKPSGLCLPSERKGAAARTCPCLPCRRPGRSPAPGSLTRPPRTPSNLALPSPAVRAGMAAKTSAAEHAPWRAAAAAPAGSEPQKCPVLAPRAMSHTCAHLSPCPGQAGWDHRPKVLQGIWGRAENDSPGSRREQ